MTQTIRTFFSKALLLRFYAGLLFLHAGLLMPADLCARPFAAPADSLTYQAFAAKLRTIFPEGKAQSLLGKLPAACTVFGFDSGDMSGDSLPDVVLSLRMADAAKKELAVWFFLGAGDTMTVAQVLTRRYIAEPIEVGFSIDDGVCHVTEKRGEFHWEIAGYAVERGIFKQVEFWETQRLRFGNQSGNTGFEVQERHATHRCTESYYRATDAKNLLRHQCYALPVFPARAKIAPDINPCIGDTSYRFIQRGASSWSGPDDCSFSVRASYDADSVVFTMRIRDDRLIAGPSPEESDRAELCFDLSGKPKVEPTNKLRAASDEAQLGVTVLLGDGEKTPPVQVLSWAGRKPETQRLVKRIAHRFAKVEAGVYLLTVTLPAALFPRSEPRSEQRSEPRSAFGFTASYFDVDQPEHPEWLTCACTSDDFDAAKPATYGRMEFLPEDAIEYEREDLNVRPLVAKMLAAGLRVQ